MFKTVACLLASSVLLAQEPSAARCRPGQLKISVWGASGGMMHIYTDIVFENCSATSCTMNSNFRLEEFDASGVRMPVQVHLNMSGDARGNGAQQVTLKPKDKTTVAVVTISRGPHDASHRCATQIHINNQLFRYKTISCLEDVFVSGFRDQR